ncbi:hypothetical protein [uncultured Eubacterium sp.]|uniref:hypothetical protein n=1 Tax=uncultured Eubacterium sp. TaxID=165185 RepID=UPI002594C6B7|nr:hypothetical protein [uncultured Eubacterium sp.]
MSKNTHTHDTNCHRNHGDPSKDAVTTGTFAQADKTDDFDYDYLGKSASANDQTGLIPSEPQNDDEIESYQDVFPFAPPLLKKDKDSLS